MSIAFINKAYISTNDVLTRIEYVEEKIEGEKKTEIPGPSIIMANGDAEAIA